MESRALEWSLGQWSRVEPKAVEWRGRAVE